MVAFAGFIQDANSRFCLFVFSCFLQIQTAAALKGYELWYIWVLLGIGICVIVVIAIVCKQYYAKKNSSVHSSPGSSTFFALAIQSLRWGGTYYTRQKINTGMVMAWSARLGTYLFSRIMHDGADRRFDNVRHRPGVFWVYWTIQGVWVFLTLLPTLLLNNKKKDRPLSTRDYAGWGLWTLGFLFEAVADYQKSRFRANPDNAGKFICNGLWSISRHPNYFGEILMWSGLYLSASSVLSGWEHIGAISPIFISFLLTRVSGIPLLEAYGKKKWGGDPDYQEYVRNTAKLVPFIW